MARLWELVMVWFVGVGDGWWESVMVGGSW